MANYNSLLANIKISHSDNGVYETATYKTTSASNVRKRLMLLKNDQKDGSHYLRTYLKNDEHGNILPRNNANMNSTASLVILDCDKSITPDGAEIIGAPDPSKVDKILNELNIGHTLYGTFSHYEGDKGYRYRINLLTNIPYTKEQLPKIVEYSINLINSKLDGNKLANAKENSVFAQPWYFTRKPENSTIEQLYLEHLDGNPIEIEDIINNTLCIATDYIPVGTITPNNSYTSPIDLYNNSTCIKQLLKRYGYVDKGHNKWLSPNSTTGNPGISVKDNKFFSHHNDEFNDGHSHSPFDLMCIKEGLTIEEAIQKISQTINTSTQSKTSKARTNDVVNNIKFNTYTPFNEELLPVEQVPLGVLPKKMNYFIEEQSEIRGCSKDFILVSLLSRMGVVFSGKLKVRLTRNTDWYVTPNFFWAMVGKSSAGKSNALTATSKYLNLLINEAKSVFKKAYSEYFIQKESLDLKINTAKKRLDKLVKTSASIDEIKTAETDLINLKQQLLEHEKNKPVLKRYTVVKVTLEKLIKILEENPQGVMLEIDELASLFIRLSKDEHAEERALYLTGYNGSSGFTYDTFKHGQLFIELLVLSITGGIQPSKLKRFLNELLSGKQDDGMLQRFQGIVYPDKYDKSAQDRTASIELDLYLQNTFYKLDQIASGTILTFDQEAQDWFDAFREEITSDAKISEYPLDAHLGKTVEFVAGLSSYLCLIDNGGNLPSNNKIVVEYVVQAIRLGEYFVSHAKRVYGLVYKDNIQGRTLSEKMVNMVVSGQFNKYYDKDTDLYSFTRSDIRTNGWKNLNSKEDRIKAITTLIEMGHISDQINGRYYINPEHLKD